MRGTVLDVTEPKVTEEALRVASGRYRLLEVMASAANEVTSLDDVLPVALSGICAYAGWQAGRSTSRRRSRPTKSF